jgi:hypothetical protein
MWSNKIVFYSFALFLISLFLLLAASSLSLATNGQSQPQSQETLEMEIKLGRGSNMVSFPFEKAYIFFNESDCYFLFNFAGKLKDPTKRAFRERYETYNLNQKKYELGGKPLVIYSYEECTLKVKGSGRLTVNEINKREDLVKLKKGLNHIPIPYDGIKLTQIKDCPIKSVMYYNSSEQVYKWYKWEPYGIGQIMFYKSNDTKTWIPIQTLNNYYLPHGISVFIDVREDCKLMFSEESTETAGATTTTTTQPTTSKVNVIEIQCPKRNDWDWCPNRVYNFGVRENEKIIIYDCNATQLVTSEIFNDISQIYFNVSAPGGKKCKLEWRVESFNAKSIYDLSIYTRYAADCVYSWSNDCEAFRKKEGNIIIANCTNETFSGTSNALVSVFTRRDGKTDTIFNVSVSITDCESK